MTADRETEKRRLRREMLALRDGMELSAAEDFNLRLWEQMERFEPLWSGRAVYTYVSYRREADTRRLIREMWARQIPVAAPRIRAGDGFMEFFWVRGEADLVEGYKGIPEPAPGCGRASDRQAIVIVPGAAFDRRGYRIGYGGGYYDRFLGRETDHRTLGLAYEFQVTDCLPAEAFDRPVDRILTDRGLISCGGSGLLLQSEGQINRKQ